MVYDIFRANLEHVVQLAAVIGNFVRIDMEDSSTTDDTLRAYRELREAGHENVGVVLQACLRRTVDDIRALAPLGLNIRLCKGIYVEPGEIAYTGFEEIRENFVRALEALLDVDAYVGIATHDDRLVTEGKRIVRRRGLEPDAYEFQMLLGVRSGLGDSLVAEGHRLRIYVPFGSQWYAYSMRRLQENPKIAGYIAADTFGRLSLAVTGAERLLDSRAVPEAPLQEIGAGVAATAEGWFVVNVRDAWWFTSERGSGTVFEGPQQAGFPEFPQLGFRVIVLEPDKPNGLDHSENQQEAFLVLFGECTLLVDGEERTLRAWDFFHCPAGTEAHLRRRRGGPAARA